MRIVVTGASGFLGSWACRVLSAQHEVIALVRETSNTYRISNLRHIQVIRLPIQLWADQIMNINPDVLVMSDWSGVSGIERNAESQRDNFNRIVTLARAAALARTRLVIGIGSQAELGPIDSKITESAGDNPTTLYGEMKVKTRLELERIFLNSATSFAWLRVFSTYGPLDDGEWLIPRIVDSLINDKEIKLTKGEQEWSFLHAYDFATAIAAVIENKLVQGIVNLGNPETVTIRSAALTVGKILGKEQLLLFGDLEYRPDQVMRLQPVCETLTALGWRPGIKFDVGIKQTLDWLMRNKINSIKTIEGETLNFNLPARL